MSDFLSQFENKNYKIEDKLSDSSNAVKTDNTDKENITKQVLGIKSDEHDIVIDASYNKNKTIRYIVIGVVIILICIMSFFAFKMFNSVKVLNFVDKNVSEAKTWGLKNKIELDLQYIFNTQVFSDIVISQDKEQNTSIQKGDILTLTISKGADPDEIIVLPDFSVMTTSQIRSWIEENKVFNTSVIQEYSDSVEVNKFIKKEFRDTAVEENNFKRKEYLSIYVSRGKEVAQKNITVPDFSNKSKTEVDTWANTNDINVVYTDVTSNTIMEGFIVSQDIPKDEYISSKDTIKLKVSIGKSVKVPNFSNITKDAAATIEPELNISVTTKFSDTIAYGKLISQSVNANVYLSGKNKNVNVVYSEGKPFIDSLMGRIEKDIAQYFYEFTMKGANVTYTIKYIDSHEEKGSVVWMSKYNEFVSINDSIELHVSKGNLKAPDIN